MQPGVEEEAALEEIGDEFRVLRTRIHSSRPTVNERGEPRGEAVGQDEVDQSILQRVGDAVSRIAEGVAESLGRQNFVVVPDGPAMIPMK